MNKQKFVAQLRSIAEELMPLTLSVAPNAKTWDGTKYSNAEAKTPDSAALVWRSVLIAVAELVEGQDSPLTLRQMEYLKRLLFGGMGSLNDLSFGRAQMDESLVRKRHLLFVAFNE